MRIEQLYTTCLAQGAYYIKSGKEAAIIDPLREIEPYIEMAERDGVSIKYIFETHFHADFVSGHLTLAQKSGATIVYGPMAKTQFKMYNATDGEVFKIGDITIKALHTPGHTLESTTYLLIDEQDRPNAIFTGDTLFLGDVGRPDLAQKSDVTKEDLAAMLYDSLRNKIMSLPDETIVYPAHGAGSACGKNMMKETVDTLGNQKKVNYALRADMTKDEFIKEVTDGLLPPPNYFPLNVSLNKNGYANIDDIVAKGLRPVTPNEFETEMLKESTIVLDVRDKDSFKNAYIPNSIFIGLDGSFAPWVGEILVDITTPILLVAPKGSEKEAVTRLARVGFDNTLGYLKGGIDDWLKEGKNTESVKSIEANELAEINEGVVIDVRKESEHQSQHLVDAINMPLSAEMKVDTLNNQKAYLHCASGYRSMIAISLLKRAGLKNLVDVKGGFAAIQNAGLKTSEFICPTTL